MNEGELTTVAAFVSLDGLLVSVINSAYQEVALLGVCSTPALWEVEVNARWKILGIELAAWLEDHWKHEKTKASLHDQIEVGVWVLCVCVCVWVVCVCVCVCVVPLEV